jgi:hypothetical protein
MVMIGRRAKADVAYRLNECKTSAVKSNQHVTVERVSAVSRTNGAIPTPGIRRVAIGERTSQARHLANNAIHTLHRPADISNLRRLGRRAHRHVIGTLPETMVVRGEPERTLGRVGQ